MLAVFQFDSVSVPVVERMLEEGRLPVLASLGDRGRLHNLTSPALYFGDRATAHTGVEVSDHGLYFPLQWSAAEQRLRRIYSLPTPEALWERLGRAGRRSLVLDPYEGRRPAAMAGVAISGLQFTHSVVLQRWSYPRGVEAPVEKRLGRSGEVQDAYGGLNAASQRRLRRQLLAAPDRAVKALLHFLPRERFDLLWTEFGSAHLAGHHFWPRAHDSPAELELKAGVLEEVYAAVDAAIGQILAALPEDVDVLVFSESGMDANASRSDLLPTMLGRVLTGRNGDAGEPGSLLWKIRSAVPARWRLRLTQMMPDRLALELWATLHLRGVDWGGTRAFALPSDHDGYIQLNVRGRERHGIVLPGQVDALVEEISGGLRSFRDPSGTPWVAGVDRVRDLYGGGAALDRLPDLLVRWSDRPSNPSDRASSEAFGEVARRGSGIGRAGNHVDGGWVLAVAGSSQPREPSRPAHLVDVAATACALLGADSAGLAGEPLLVGE